MSAPACVSRGVNRSGDREFRTHLKKKKKKKKKKTRPPPPKTNTKQITDHSISAFELEEKGAEEVVEGPVGALLGEAKVRACVRVGCNCCRLGDLLLRPIPPPHTPKKPGTRRDQERLLRARPPAPPRRLAAGLHPDHRGRGVRRGDGKRDARGGGQGVGAAAAVRAALLWIGLPHKVLARTNGGHGWAGESRKKKLVKSGWGW